MTSDGPKSPALPPLPTVSDVATILTRPTPKQELDAAPSLGKPWRTHDGDLRRAVAAAENAEPLPGLADVRAHRA